MWLYINHGLDWKVGRSLIADAARLSSAVVLFIIYDFLNIQALHGPSFIQTSNVKEVEISFSLQSEKRFAVFTILICLIIV